MQKSPAKVTPGAIPQCLAKCPGEQERLRMRTSNAGIILHLVSKGRAGNLPCAEHESWGWLNGDIMLYVNKVKLKNLR